MIRSSAIASFLFAAFCELTPQEMGKLFGYLAHGAELKNTKEELDDYIDVLVTHNNRLTGEKIAEMSLNDISELAKKLEAKKK